MSRWLALAEVGKENLIPPFDTSTKVDRREVGDQKEGFCPLLSTCRRGVKEKDSVPPDVHTDTVKPVEIVGTAAPRQTGASLVLSAIEQGNIPGCKWQPRHGSISTKTGLGGTVTYQLIDRLIEQGRVEQARDGVLSIKGAGK